MNYSQPISFGFIKQYSSTVNPAEQAKQSAVIAIQHMIASFWAYCSQPISFGFIKQYSSTVIPNEQAKQSAVKASQHMTAS